MSRNPISISSVGLHNPQRDSPMSSATPKSGGESATAEYDAAVCKDVDELHGTQEEMRDLSTVCQAEAEAVKPIPSLPERVLGRVLPSGGLWSGVFNLAASSLGAGILGLPYAFQTSGILMGTIHLTVIYLLTVYSVRLLAIVYTKTGIRSYELTARYVFGRGGDIFVAIIMFVKCIGACVAYVICINDLWSSFLSDHRVEGYYRSLSFQRVLTTVTFLLLMLPLSLPRQINSLRYVSLFGVVFVLFFVACVIAHSATHGLKEGFSNRNLHLFTTGNRAIQGLGHFVFAFLCQSNAYQVFNETPKPSVRFFEMQVLVSMAVCTTLYWLAGFFGYCDFGDKVQSSLLRVYRPLTDYYIAVAYIGLVVKLCVAFALHISPCRDSVHHLLGWNLHTIAWWKNALLCTCLCVIALLAGLFIPNVNVVFGLLGSFTGAFIAFVFPALFFIYSGGFELKKVGAYNFFGSLVLLLCGVIIISFGTTATIYGVL
ncbi:hypothetical protein JKF63_04352 [Porcisia hertigi]|uniref:Amino acid transporter transmembrane domain-containing protein n=1 Tax=Porcisia hertigi TaxID=2761500 RepID=A0A836LAC7_9TRYP|nr:hypothetical protein JKF63_04352 [Porcisia hertigi]